MLRPSAVLIVLAAAVAACGGGGGGKEDTRGGGDGPAARAEQAERFQRTAVGLCDRFNKGLVEMTALPSNARQGRRFVRRVFARERRLLSRLAKLEPRAHHRRLLARAVRSRRQAISAQLAGRRDARFRRRGYDAFLALGLHSCAGFGASALPDAGRWTTIKGRWCRRVSRPIARAARRAGRASTPAEASAALRAVERSVSRAGVEYGFRSRPIDAQHLDIVLHLELRKVAAGTRRLRSAAERGDRQGTERAQAAIKRSLNRARAASLLLNVPHCGRILDALA